tara:strand:+ start:546 stop:1118 length:573 start_codon:yes stop_codon:yes gene_type:complete
MVWLRVWEANRYLLAFLIVGLLNTIVQHVLMLAEVNNLFLLFFYFPIELLLVSAFIQNKPRISTVAIYLFLLSIVISVFEALFIGINTFPIYTIIYVSAVLLYYSYNQLLYMVNSNLSVNYKIEKDGTFWFASGLLIYVSSRIILFLFSSYLQVNYPQALHRLWVFVEIFNILFYLTISLGVIRIWKSNR